MNLFYSGETYLTDIMNIFKILKSFPGFSINISGNISILLKILTAIVLIIRKGLK